MQITIPSAMALACALMLCACATTPPPDSEPLVAAARDNIASTEIVAPVKQSELYIYVAPSSDPGSELIGALIVAAVDSHNASKVETAIKPLRDAMIDYSFDNALKKDLSADLSPVKWLNVSDVRVIRDGTQTGMDQAVGDSKHAAVLVVQADYQLDWFAKTMTVNIWTDLYGKDAKLAPYRPPTGDPKHAASQANAIYYNHFWNEVSLPDAGQDRDANIRPWSADGGKRARAALDDLAAKVAADLSQDIQAAPPPDTRAPPPAGR